MKLIKKMVLTLFTLSMDRRPFCLRKMAVFLNERGYTVKNIGAVALLLCLCFQTVGCGKAKASREPIFKVSGKVIYKGQPVEDADVIFNCADKNRSAFGRTNEKGEFKLTTFVSNDGAVPGKHVVLVTKIQTSAAVAVADISDASYEPPKLHESTDPKPKNTIPSKYSDAKKSDLFAVVTEGENPEMVLELKD